MADFKNQIKIITQGSTSHTLSLPHIFIKYIEKYKEYDVYKREKYMASLLNRFEWYPTLLYSDDLHQILIFRNVGVSINNKNKPKNLEKQFNKILKDMKSLNIKHNDIKNEEILVGKNNKIYLCDFGWASIDDDLGCKIGLCNKPKPAGIIDDDSTLKRLKLI